MRFRSVRAAGAAVLAIVLSAGLVAGASPSIQITSVDGQTPRRGEIPRPVSGTIEVRGTGEPGGDPAAPPAAQPLVADAGDSPFVPSGAKTTLIGAAWGGKEPYRWAWTAQGGTIAEGADSATALLDTAGLAPGRYTATLRVTDAAGAAATDTVIVVVARAGSQTFLDETKSDPVVANVGLGNPTLTNYLDFPFDLPAGITALRVEATWINPANDYDLHLVDPAGTERGYSGNGATNLVLNLEESGAGGPQPGRWVVRMERYLTVTDDVTVTVIGQQQDVDPRPSVDAGGPYRFEIGATQVLDGTVGGGAAPVAAKWDLDDNGTFETNGADTTADLPAGHHLVALKATDADGLERRQMTSVLVADAERLAQDTTAVTVIGVADSGINPYHLEFGAATYPDPDVLALTDGFQRHPSTYISGYPSDAAELRLTIGQGYYPAKDKPVFAGVQQGRLYWLPGTKIIGAVDANNSSASNAAADATPILDDDGHGTGSSSVSAGNRYGYCPTCLLFFVEGLDETIATSYPFVDITSHSFGYNAGAPVGLVVGPNSATRAAAERGQITLFAAGNGVGNAFDVPQITYGSDQTGASWNITVGAIRRDSQRAIIGDGIPAHISAWGDGNLPSACRTGTVGQCAFGGTSAATPYTAGIFGTVLTAVRREIGDPFVGQRSGQVVAEGRAIEASTMLADGKLTRTELREAVLKTALPLNTGESPFPVPLPGHRAVHGRCECPVRGLRCRDARGRPARDRRDPRSGAAPGSELRGPVLPPRRRGEGHPLRWLRPRRRRRHRLPGPRDRGDHSDRRRLDHRRPGRAPARLRRARAKPRGADRPERRDLLPAPAVRRRAGQGGRLQPRQQRVLPRRVEQRRRSRVLREPGHERSGGLPAAGHLRPGRHARRAHPRRVDGLRHDLRGLGDRDRGSGDRRAHGHRSGDRDRDERRPADPRLRDGPGLERPGQPAAGRRPVRHGRRAVLDEVRPVVRDDAAGLHRRAADLPDPAPGRARVRLRARGPARLASSRSCTRPCRTAASSSA